MGQVTIYLDDEHEHRLRRAAQSAGMPVSRWVANLVEEKTRNEWPESIRAMAGAWAKGSLNAAVMVKSPTGTWLRSLVL